MNDILRDDYIRAAEDAIAALGKAVNSRLVEDFDAFLVAEDHRANLSGHIKVALHKDFYKWR